MVQDLISSHSAMWGNVFENSFSAFKFGFLSWQHSSTLR